VAQWFPADEVFFQLGFLQAMKIERFRDNSVVCDGLLSVPYQFMWISLKLYEIFTPSSNHFFKDFEGHFFN